MSSANSRFCFSNDDGGELLSSLRSLFNRQDSNHNDSNNTKDEKLFPNHENSTEDVDFNQIESSDFRCNWLTSTANMDNVKVLLVFGRNDRQSDVLVSASERLGWHISEARKADDAFELFQTHYHDIVIIDRRDTHSQQADEICRTLPNAHNHQKSVIVALVKQSLFTESNEDELATLQILDAGYNRTLIECSCQQIIMNELVGIYTNEVRPKVQLATAHSLYLAVHRCRDMVHVTNDRHVIQFANEVSEKLLGYKLNELANKNLGEIISCDNFNAMNQLLQKGQEFQGLMNCKRKFHGGILTLNSKIIPFCAYGRRPTHYIYIYDTTYLLENIEAMPTGSPHAITHLHPRGSAHSLRSFDLASINSDLQRRSSIAKLHNLPLEAPITKVITLLTTAMMDATTSDMANQIDKAIEILKTTELYAPYVKEAGDLTNDPITSDLIGALISTPLYARDSRRSSNDSISRINQVQRILHQQSPKTTVRSQRGPREIELLLTNSLDWGFDIFKLETLSERRPLYYLGMHIMNLYNVPAHLKCEERVLLNWLAVVEGSYNVKNSYHNSTHAADVLQATAHFMMSDRLKALLSPLDQAAALIAAAAHDIDHPGVTSQFICNAKQKLAILYNDISVLESHHAALTFKLTLTDPEVNIFKKLDNDTYKAIRQNIIDMILATDMSKHYEHLAKFVNICSMRSEESISEPYSDILDSSPFSMSENITLVKRMMIKCADVSNPARPLKFCIEWSKRIAEEYFRQTETEQEKNLPVTMPAFERSTCNISTSQIGFIDFIVNGMMEAWDAFIDLPELIMCMRHNYSVWKEHSKCDVFTVQDCEKLQQSLESQVSQST